MRQLGEQWIENGKIYKAVQQESKIIGGILYGNICHGCCHVDKWDDDCLHPSEMCPVEKGLIVKDLGPVNDAGFLVCPFCGEYQEMDEQENWEGDAVWFFECSGCGARTAEYLEAEEARFAWNRRTV